MAIRPARERTFTGFIAVVDGIPQYGTYADTQADVRDLISVLVDAYGDPFPAYRIVPCRLCVDHESIQD